jgi:putative membrane protein
MSDLGSFWISYWWVFFLIMMVFCFFGMRGRRGSGMCGFRAWGTDTRDIPTTDSAIDILDKRYALGEITREEYEEMKKTICQGRA